jgi:hypothetical protein
LISTVRASALSDIQTGPDAHEVDQQRALRPDECAEMALVNGND